MAQDLRNLRAERIKFEIDGRLYHWDGGFGSIFYSREPDVTPGTVRVIGGVIFTAYLVSHADCRWWLRCLPKVCWTLPEPFKAEILQTIKQHLFGV